MAGWCRGLQKCLCLRTDTFPDKPSQFQVSACSATASPTVGQSYRTTCHVPNSSSAERLIGISETLRREIERRAHRLFCHVEPESDEVQQTIDILFRLAVLPL